MAMIKHYILEGEDIVAVDLMTWARWMQAALEECVVDKTTIGDAEVSTVFLGLDHSFGYNGPPLLFETLVFGGELDGQMHRYSTREEAQIGHAVAGVEGADFGILPEIANENDLIDAAGHGNALYGLGVLVTFHTLTVRVNR